MKNLSFKSRAEVMALLMLVPLLAFTPTAAVILSQPNCDNNPGGDFIEVCAWWEDGEASASTLADGGYGTYIEHEYWWTPTSVWDPGWYYENNAGGWLPAFESDVVTGGTSCPDVYVTHGATVDNVPWTYTGQYGCNVNR